MRSHDDPDRRTRDEADETGAPSEPPNALRDLAEFVGEKVDRILEDFGKLPEVHKERIALITNERLRQLDAVSFIDAETSARIRPVIADAVTCLESREWISTFSFARRLNPRLEGTFILGCMLGFWAIVVPVSISRVIRFGLPDLKSYGIALLVTVAALAARYMTHKLLSWRWLRALARLVTSSALVVATITFSTWSESAFVTLSQLSRYTPPWIGGILSSDGLHHVMYAGLWVAAAVSVIDVFWRAARTTFEAVVSMSTHSRSSAEVQSALLIDGLLGIAHKLETGARDDTGQPAFYLSSDFRINIMWELERLAAIVEGPWIRSLKTGYRSTDVWLAQRAREMSSAFLKWQPLVAFGGAHLRDMKAAFADALIRACDGDWNLLATESGAIPESIIKRSATLIRRLVTAFVPAAISLVTVRFVASIPPSYGATILLTGFGTSAIYLLSLLDARFADIVASATKFTGVLRK